MNPDDSPWAETTGSSGFAEQAAPRSADRRSAADEDLRESLAGLSQLATNRLPLEDLLTRVAIYAVKAIPGADGAGLTLLEEDRSDTVVSTAPFVREIDDIQYGMGQGPCITAARDGRTQSVLLAPRERTRGGRDSAARSPGSACTAWCRCH